MGKIKILSKHLADKIAAGEVVERPASVVKELLENSLDAKSRNIQVLIEDAGLKSIQVIDDGLGIEPDDLSQACLRHATSKISQDKDLDHISTLGFRGEALASIAAVSRVVICSKSEIAEDAMQIEVHGGKIGDITKTARTQGTTIEVNNLFYNTPARLKFLKTNAAETAQISRVVTELALANPDVSFKLINNKKEIINCSAGQDVLKRIEVLFGRELVSGLIPVSLNIAPLKIKGYISRAGIGHASRKHQYLFVNQRVVADKTITHAVIQGYGTFLLERKFPAVLLFIETAPELIDVNVHPSKREIRFQDAGVLHDMIYRMVKEALSSKENMPEFLNKASLTDEYENVSYSPDNQLPKDMSYYFPKAKPVQTFSGSYTERVPQELFSVKDDTKGLFSGGPEQAYVKTKAADYLQVHNTYIVGQNEQGIVVIDQHAAHERVIFDSLLEQFKRKNIETQKLLIPVTVQLSAQEFLLITEHKDAFQSLGFEIEDFGDNTAAVYSYPAILGKIDVKEEVKAILADISEFDISPDLNKKIVQFLAPIACHSAVRANEKLSPEKISALLQSLWQTESSQTCPHGRPTVINISWSELERKFKRK